MNQEEIRAIEAKVYNSAVYFRIQDSAQAAAQFLSAAESPFEWHLRIKYIAAWTCGTPGIISEEVWNVIRKDSWVTTTAVVLGVTGQPTPGVEVEKIQIAPLYM